MRNIGVGLIGSGFMGRAHAHAFGAVGGLFRLSLTPRLTLLADANERLATAAARELGFARSTGDWRALVNDPEVGVVAITSPTAMHKEMALAAIAQGKAVYCEKPLGANLADAKKMLDAAEAAKITTLVGFNYLKNPLLATAREMVEAGELGQVVSFRGVHAEDYMADPTTPYSWRCAQEGGGVTADLGSHIISLARYLVGAIDAVSAHLQTVHKSRPVAVGSRETKAVAVDDQCHSIVRFHNGASGSLHASWLAHGRKMQLEFELVGTKGSLVFSQERFNELRCYSAGQAPGRSGFKTLLSGPDHPDYAAFCPAPGHQLGFNDLKIIEVKSLLQSLAENKPASPDFREAFEIARTVDAISRSSHSGAWVKIA